MTNNLNEELGQVSQIFSDKTGTLTSNVMQFRKFSVGLKSYGVEGDNREMMRFRNSMPGNVPNVNFEDESFYSDQSNDQKQAKNIQRMLFNLAVNHSVLIHEVNGEIHYNASSPDELALVNGARFLGITFTKRDEDNNIFIKQGNQTIKFELLNVLGFDSIRKRMSVIVRNTQTNIIHVMCKGADSVLLPLVKDR